GVPFAPGEAVPVEARVEAYARRISNTPAARAALRTLFAAAQRDPVPATLPPDVRAAYADLEREAGLGDEGEGASPGNDRETSDAEERYQLAKQDAAVSFGIGDIVPTLLSPLQQLSFWKMKD